MTISSETRLAGPYTGNDSADTFAFSFKVFAADEVSVVRTASSSGANETLILNADYTVALNSNQNAAPGGSITLIAGPLATGYKLTLISDIEYYQPVDLTNQGAFYPDVINDALDRACIQTQQVQSGVSRSIKVPQVDGITDDIFLPTKEQRADSTLAFDGDGLPVVGPKIVELATVTSIAGAINTVSANITAVNAINDNLVDVGICATNISDIVDAKNQATNAANSASAAATSAGNASSSASSAATYASAAASSAAAAGLPTGLVGSAKQFLQVKADETGYDLVSSVAAPAFYGFNLINNGTELELTYGRDDYAVSDFDTWMMSENISFAVTGNSLVLSL